MGLLYEFVETKMLCWMEALGMLRHIESAVPALIRVLDRCEESDPSYPLLKDGLRFVRFCMDAIQTCPFHVYTSGLVFSPTKSLLRQMYIHEVDDLAVVDILAGHDEIWGPCSRVMTGHTSNISHVSFSHDGRWIASAGHDSTICIWDAMIGVILRILSGHKKPVTGCIFSLDDKTVVSCSRDQTIRTWDSTSGATLKVIVLSGYLINWVDLLPATSNTSPMIVAGLSSSSQQSDSIQVFDMDVSASSVRQILESDTSGLQIDFPYLFQGLGTVMTAAWDAGKLLLSPRRNFFEGLDGRRYIHKVIPQSDLLLASCLTASTADIELWRLTARECIHIFVGHENSISTVAVHPSQEIFASGSADNTIRLWSLQKRTCLAVFSWVGATYALAFRPSGESLVSACHEGVRSWDIPSMSSPFDPLSFTQSTTKRSIPSPSAGGPFMATVRGLGRPPTIWFLQENSQCRLATNGIQDGHVLDTDFDTDFDTTVWGISSTSTSQTSNWMCARLQQWPVDGGPGEPKGISLTNTVSGRAFYLDDDALDGSETIEDMEVRGVSPDGRFIYLSGRNNAEQWPDEEEIDRRWSRLDWRTHKVDVTTMKLQIIALTFLTFALAAQDDQQPMTSPQEPVYQPQTTIRPTLADLLTIESSASIFYSYARELEMSAVLADVSAKTTLLVPTNKAVMALSRKPHEGPETMGEVIISDEEFDNVSKRNVERWVSAHMIADAPESLEPKTYTTLLHKKTVTLSLDPNADSKLPEWKRLLVNGESHIVGRKEALNGVFYLIDGTISVD
ncbi:hypothetical protein ONZ45_g15802 [Pleurotus djamor]|nr:hypothetical protein ONZ45_g15802 [Pleurotus djamor]